MAYKKLKYWFDRDLAVLLSEKIRAHCESFNAEDFIGAVAEGTKNLELKDRVEFIADQLQANLPTDFTQALDILLQTSGPENENETGMFSEYYWVMPIAKYVEKYGPDHFPVLRRHGSPGFEARGGRVYLGQQGGCLSGRAGLPMKNRRIVN